MALSDEDKKEVGDLIAAGFGSDAFTKTISDATNAVVNAYDKRKTKEGEKAGEALTKLTEQVAELAKTKVKPDPDDDDDKHKDLPPAVAEQLAALEKANKLLAEQNEKTLKIAEDAETARKAAEDKAAVTAQTDAIRDAALSKDVGVDPARLPILLSHLSQLGLVKANEAGNGYVMHSGNNKITGEAEDGPLAETLAAFVKSDAGAMFRPAVSGQGSGGKLGDATKTVEGQVAVSGEMTPQQIRELADAGKLDLSQPIQSE